VVLNEEPEKKKAFSIPNELALPFYDCWIEEQYKLLTQLNIFHIKIYFIQRK